MPEISRFMGIVIGMFYRDHEPAHFHARYGGYHITVEIDSGRVNGRFPVRQRALVLQWLNQHRRELRENWDRALRREALTAVPPLE